MLLEIEDKRDSGRGFWNIGEKFSGDFRESLEEILEINEKGLVGRLSGYVMFISRTFQGGDIWGT